MYKYACTVNEVVFLAYERTLTLKKSRVTLARPQPQSSSAAGCTILPLCWAAPRCVCVCPTLLPLQLLPQAFAVNKNVFSVDLPGYIRVKKSVGIKNVPLSIVYSDETLFSHEMKINVSTD